jgi:hypothetical protein
MILEFWSLFVLIKVAVRVDHGVGALEVVRTLTTDPIGLMREGSDASLGGTGLCLAHELENACVGHEA